jgi:hypothetical protein
VVQVRRLGTRDIDAIAELTAHAFGGADPESVRALQKAANQLCPFMPADLCWGVEIGGRLVAKWQLIDMTARIGQARFRLAGAHAVAVHRDHAGQSLIGELMQRARREVEGLGFELIVGFAQRGALYTALGGVPFCAEYEWSCDALKLPTAEDCVWRDFQDADLPELVRLYNAAQAGRSGSLVRSAVQWPWLLRKPPRVLMGAGGYLGLRENSESLELREAGFDAPGFAEAALRGLSTLARRKGLRRIHGHLPLDHPIVQASIPYGAELALRYEKRAGAMGGIVHVANFLRRLQPELLARWSRSVFAGRALTLSLAIDGDAHELEFDAGGTRSQAILLSLPASALLQLAMGYRSATAALASLAADGSSTANALLGDQVALGMLEVLFPAAHPFISHTDRW